MPAGLNSVAFELRPSRARANAPESAGAVLLLVIVTVCKKCFVALFSRKPVSRDGELRSDVGSTEGLLTNGGRRFCRSFSKFCVPNQITRDAIEAIRVPRRPVVIADVAVVFNCQSTNGPPLSDT